jgi:hypothetical protein
MYINRNTAKPDAFITGCKTNAPPHLGELGSISGLPGVLQVRLQLDDALLELAAQVEMESET